MNQGKSINNKTLWISVLVAAGVALFISVVVSLALQVPGILLRLPRPAPEVVGMTVSQAEESLRDSRLVLLTVGQEPSDETEGTILSQEPGPENKVRPGDIIQVMVSSGDPTVQVPSLSGVTLPEATEKLEASGLFVSDVISEYDTLAEDVVIGTRPEAGSVVEKGGSIKLVVSLGPELAEVPRVTGKKLGSAKTMLTEHGFSLGKVTYQVTGEYYQGTVMKQTPEPGESSAIGSSVDLVVAGVLR